MKKLTLEEELLAVQGLMLKTQKRHARTRDGSEANIHNSNLLDVLRAKEAGLKVAQRRLSGSARTQKTTLTAKTL